MEVGLACVICAVWLLVSIPASCRYIDGMKKDDVKFRYAFPAMLLVAVFEVAFMAAVFLLVTGELESK